MYCISRGLGHFTQTHIFRHSKLLPHFPCQLKQTEEPLWQAIHSFSFQPQAQQQTLQHNKQPPEVKQMLRPIPKPAAQLQQLRFCSYMSTRSAVVPSPCQGIKGLLAFHAHGYFVVSYPPRCSLPKLSILPGGRGRMGKKKKKKARIKSCAVL